jgi:hypothetical protein
LTDPTIQFDDATKYNMFAAVRGGTPVPDVAIAFGCSEAQVKNTVSALSISWGINPEIAQQIQ